MGWVESGFKTVVEALLEIVGPTGAIYGLSYTNLFPLPLKGRHAEYVFDRQVPSYAGGLPNFLLTYPGSARSHHPSNSLVGVGAGSEEILAPHTGRFMAYEPIHRLAQDDRGKMLTIGLVDAHPGFSTPHVAQNILQWENRRMGTMGARYRAPNGEIKLYVHNYAGGCSRGFGCFYPAYREHGAVSEGKLGAAKAMLATLRKTLEVDLDILKRDPTFLFCDDRGCYSCRRSWDFYREPWWSWYPYRLAHLGNAAIRRLLSQDRRGSGTTS